MSVGGGPGLRHRAPGAWHVGGSARRLFCGVRELYRRHLARGLNHHPVIEERLGVLGVELEVDEGVGLGRAADRRELGGDHDIGALLMGRRLGVVLGAALAVEHRAGGLLGGCEDAAADLGVALEDVLHMLELADAIEQLLGAAVVLAGREDLHRLHVVDHGLLDLPFALVDLP